MRRRSRVESGFAAGKQGCRVPGLRADSGRKHRDEQSRGSRSQAVNLKFFMLRPARTRTRSGRVVLPRTREGSVAGCCGYKTGHKHESALSGEVQRSCAPVTRAPHSQTSKYWQSWAVPNQGGKQHGAPKQAVAPAPAPVQGPQRACGNGDLIMGLFQHARKLIDGLYIAWSLHAINRRVPWPETAPQSALGCR